MFRGRKRELSLFCILFFFFLPHIQRVVVHGTIHYRKTQKSNKCATLNAIITFHHRRVAKDVPTERTNERRGAMLARADAFNGAEKEKTTMAGHGSDGIGGRLGARPAMRQDTIIAATMVGRATRNGSSPTLPRDMPVSMTQSSKNERIECGKWKGISRVDGNIRTVVGCHGRGNCCNGTNAHGRIRTNDDNETTTTHVPHELFSL